MLNHSTSGFHTFGIVHTPQLFTKMMSVGLEPDEEVGFAHKIPIYKLIRQMNKARDKKAAHGSTPNRKITISELMEYQACTSYVAWGTIENKLGESIYSNKV